MDQPDNVELYLHVRVLISVVLGLGLTRLLSGLSRFVQHPGQERIYGTHLLWVLILIVSMMHFWWWEFGLIREEWRFELYAFVLFYAFLFFLLASLLFPDSLSDYAGYEDYFISRRRWFFGILALSQVVDIVDTLIKGTDRLAALGLEYELRVAAIFSVCVIAMFAANRRFHLLFALIYLVYQISWIARVYDRIG